MHELLQVFMYHICIYVYLCVHVNMYDFFSYIKLEIDLFSFIFMPF